MNEVEATEVKVVYSDGRVIRLKGSDARRVEEKISAFISSSEFTFTNTEGILGAKPLRKVTEVRGRHTVSDNGKHYITAEDHLQIGMGLGWLVPEATLPLMTDRRGPLFDFVVDVEAYPVGEKSKQGT